MSPMFSIFFSELLSFDSFLHSLLKVQACKENKNLLKVKFAS